MLLFIVALFVLLTVILLIFVNKQRRPHVKDIWVINLDKDAARMKSVRAQTSHIADIVHRWPATHGTTCKREAIHEEGVGYAMTRTGDQKEDARGALRNAGVVGCWLSHKRLLTHLASLDVPDSHGHLIVEDDVQFPAGFLKPGDAWHGIYHRIPTNWDMVYLGLTQPVGKPIGDGILRARTAHRGEGNWGTHAYLVRHGALRAKILPWLAHMVDAIDEQYNLKFDEWNVYVVEPALIGLNDVHSKNSSVLKMNVNADDSARISYL